MEITELDFHLPPELIATHPAQPRDSSRLMVVRRAAETVEHRHFYDLPDLLEAADVLVVNDTRVLPARLVLRRPTGAMIPGLFLSEIVPGRWEVMLRSRGKLSPGDALHVERSSESARDEIAIRVAERLPERGRWVIEISPALPAAQLLERIGHVPLPPYIEKARRTAWNNEKPRHSGAELADLSGDAQETIDRTEYQTVYARLPGSLAAPTAGLHFTPGVLDRLAARGIGRLPVTLHVGLGTFLPVETQTLEGHKMHAETYSVPGATVGALRSLRASGKGRIVVVGTTAARTLESAAAEILGCEAPAADLAGSTALCISPGYRFELTDVLLTNFHLPRSTLLALVAALVGLERMRALYAEAIRERYRFYSYGDAMLILP